MKTSEKERIRNRGYRSELRSEIRDLRLETDPEAAATKFKRVESLLDKAADYHLIHKKNADRNKSRLSSFVSKLGK